MTGYFEGNGAASAYSVAPFFKAVRTPVVGRFALPGGNPYAPDSSVPIRSLALKLTAPDGEQWRTGMNAMPVFPVATPQAFYAQLLATRADPKTGQARSGEGEGVFGAHPETAAFREWVKGAKPSASYVTESYYGLNAFYFVDAAGKQQAVRWRVVPEQTAGAGDVATAADPGVLQQDVTQRIAAGPQKWKLLVTLAGLATRWTTRRRSGPRSSRRSMRARSCSTAWSAGQRAVPRCELRPDGAAAGFRRRGSVAGGAVGGLCGFVSAQDK